MDDDSTLNDWVARARAGEEVAFRHLYDACVGRVYRLAWRMCRDEELARDLTQESFIRAFGALDGFRGDARFSSWLHRIAVRTILNGLRRDERHQANRDDYSLELVPTNGSSPHGFALRDRLRSAVGTLPEIYRIVFLMHDLEGWTHREIAESLEVEVGTSKARLSRARARLREALGEDMLEYIG